MAFYSPSHSNFAFSDDTEFKVVIWGIFTPQKSTTYRQHFLLSYGQLVSWLLNNYQLPVYYSLEI